MKTSEFLELLKEHQSKSLLFQYAPQQLVGANYHITEVKHIKIESVDCGAQTDSWNETVIQLWESPSELGKTEYMSSLKALGILNKVGKMKPYDLSSEIKFEYSNALFHTAQLFVGDFEIYGNNLVINLNIQKTDCKAKELCGVPETATVSEDSNSCAPGSGCC
ncbi:MAG: hypothetical protein CMC70_08610 [Flavobacteriaceae bacterium]|nr:hypothetical protein [Flavobacteriaceae bacterium]|tara:strand:+ start:1228 stop:1719 length:492 start_codon:yes stop_codon:yes gene_type:complete